MRQLRVPGVVLSLLLLGGGIDAADEIPAIADCQLDAATYETPRERWRKITADVEALAPSGLTAVVNATGSSRRRASEKPVPAVFVRQNFIDDEIFGKMIKDGVRWAAPASDAEFLRRVTMDLTGEIPDAARVKEFLASNDPNKREKEVDRLLASEAYADRWALWFGDLAQNTIAASNTAVRAQARNAFHGFMRSSFASGKPYDQMVREILAATGSSFTADSPLNYYARLRQDNGPIQDTYDNLSADTGEKFLGLPLNCLSCHSGLAHLEQVNTGLVKKTRTDFWKNAAFFAQTNMTQSRSGTNVGELIVSGIPLVAEYRLNTTNGNKSARIPPPGQSAVVAPAFFLTGEQPQANEDRRVAYARMLTAHPQFARATVNYLWKEIFGLGIVEPADSFDLIRQDPATLAANATLQPTHPELLTKLATEFAAKNYSVRSILKTMVLSSAYGLSSRYDAGQWHETMTPYFARHFARRLQAEMMLDAVVKATSVPVSLAVQQAATPYTKAVALPDVAEPGRGVAAGSFLNAFGRGDRDLNPRSHDSSIVQTLMMLNDPVVATRVRAAGNSTTDKLLKATRDPATIADELYVITLSRYPTAAEKQAAIAYLANGDVARNTEDLQFALLNRLEFLFN